MTPDDQRAYHASLLFYEKELKRAERELRVLTEAARAVCDAEHINEVLVTRRALRRVLDDPSRQLDFCDATGEYLRAEDHDCDGCGVLDDHPRSEVAAFLERELPTIWSCSHCGPHPESTATWCAAGCGRDYSAMSGESV